MSSRFNERWKRNAEPQLSRQFSSTETSDAATYADDTSKAPVTLVGPLITREKQDRRFDVAMGGWRAVTTRTIRYTKTGNPTTILDGIVIVGGRKYTIENVMDIEGDRTQLELIRVTSGEISRREYRR